MTDEQPIWRQALNDPEHPLYQAAWLIFSGSGSPQYMTKVLEPRKEEIIPFLLAILREPELYKEKSLGMGKAPFRTMTTLIDWKVTEALPDLFKSVEYSELHEEMIDEDGEYEGDFDAYDAIESIFR